MARKRKSTHPIHDEDPTFPLSYNATNGSWYKGFRGRRYYFGSGTPQEALKRYEAEWSYIVSGQPIPTARGALTVADLFNHYLNEMHKDLKAGRIGERYFDEVRDILAWAAGKLGKKTPISTITPLTMGGLCREIEARQPNSPTVRQTWLGRIRRPFTWAEANDIHGYTPVRFGSGWRRPTKAEFRERAMEVGRLDFTAEEVRRLIEAANPTLKAAILLAMNCGYEPNEITAARRSWLVDGWLDHLREKTKEYRRVPMWQETLDAIERTTPRRKPKTRDNLLVSRLLTPYDPQDAFIALKHRLGIKLRGAGFGKLRTTHRTVTDEVGDLNAQRLVMGHGIKGIESHYVKRISDERLRRVTDHAHNWLYG